MNTLKLKIPETQLVEFCRKYNIKKLAFFGSVLRDDFKPTSDVDILVEFEAGYNPGLDFFGMPEELKNIFGRHVDLLTYKGIQASKNPIRRKAILESAQVYYVA